jgi:hypothetical protein
MRAFALALLLAIAPLQAHALSRNTSTVVTTSLYGIVGGAALGLVAWPLTGSSRALGIGASLGLWLGIAVGIYHNGHRDDPGNPLNALLGPRLFPEEWEHSPFQPQQDNVAVSLAVPVLDF